jgi:capsular polysaccharide biosynthesis protein
VTQPAPEAGGGRGPVWWFVRLAAAVVAAALVAGGVYVVSAAAPATYESSSTVRVSVQAPTGSTDQSVIASNDLASQYAQVVSADRVLRAARRRLTSTDADLSGEVSAGTVAAQNLIRLTVKGTNPGQAERRAAAVTQAFVAYLNRLSAEISERYAASVNEKLAPVDANIADARKALETGTPDAQRNAASILAGLLVQRQQVLSSVAQSSAATRPSIQRVTNAGTASKVSPKPKLYAAIAFAIVLLLLARLTYVAAGRSRRNDPA